MSTNMSRFVLRRQTGFSLVELVTVLALIGVLSAVAFSRFTNTSSFEESLFSSQLVSYLRLTQRTAVAHQGSASTIDIQRVTAESWQFDINFDGETVSKTLENPSALSYASGAVSGTIGVGDTLTLEFSEEGDFNRILSPAVSTVSNSLELTIAGRSACLSLTGFAYEGACL